MTISKKEMLRSLKAARKLISKRDNWCQGTLARDKNGDDIAPNNKKACSWCILGAISKVRNCSDYPAKQFKNYFAKVVPEVDSFNPITAFNDNNNHKTLIKTLDSTIDKLDSSL